MLVVDQLRTVGKVTRGRLGVQIRGLEKEEADALGLKQQGALVAHVERGSPAEKANVQAGDIIQKFDGQTIVHSTDLPRLVGDTKPGTHSVLTVWRKGTVRDLPIVVEELDAAANPAAPGKPEEPKTLSANSLGLVVTELTQDKRKDLDLSLGVVVASVDGPAAVADVRPGDIIVQLNNADVNGTRQFVEMASKLDPKKPAVLLVRRGDAVRYVPIRPQQP
jgi:serine protease Do